MAFRVSRPSTLDNLAPGRRVADVDTDLWTKLPDGQWSCDVSQGQLVKSAEALLYVFGPVTIIPEGGI